MASETTPPPSPSPVLSPSQQQQQQQQPPPSSPPPPPSVAPIPQPLPLSLPQTQTQTQPLPPPAPLSPLPQKRVAKEADHVFVLMTNRYRVSRNSRAQWYFNHLNRTIEVTPKESLEEFSEEIEIVSALPSNYQDDWETEEPTSGPYLITTNTKVTFFARRYRLVFILDLSPSMSTVDTQCNKVLYEEIFVALSRSLKGLSQPFFVPGSKFLFSPEINVTVLAHSPFYTSEGQQVLAQGWRISTENVDMFLSTVSTRLQEVTVSVAEVTARANEQRESLKTDVEYHIGSLFDDTDAKSLIAMTTPDIAMINMFRYGLLALQLLPENSNAGIVIITDGMLSLPNSSVLENMLNQSRNHNIACSFLQIGSNPHPHSCFGYVPYTDIMKFITTATFGAYLSRCPEPELNSTSFNVYHRAFMAWNFQRGLCGFKADVNHQHLRTGNYWHVENPYFYSSNDQDAARFSSTLDPKDQQLVRNKQMESSVATSFTNVLSCRLREGYTIKNVKFSKNETQIEVTLVLPWKYNVNIEYSIISSWTPNTKQSEKAMESTECRYEVIIEGSYYFLHDVTCQIKKPLRSPYREAAVKQFWSTLKSLSDSDKLLVHLNNFSRNPGLCIPESIRSGITLFYLAPNSSNLVLAAKNSAHAQFSTYWKQICLLDPNIWQKWMHAHRINLILEHEMPFPKHFHLPNGNGRYAHIQCFFALASISNLLKDYSSFVMLENHSYIKMIQSGPNEGPESFFVIRVTQQLPCMVIHVAFIGGTPGCLRHKIVSELKEMIGSCKLPKRNIAKSSHQLKKLEKHDSLLDGSKSSPTPLQRDWVDMHCCVLTRKPIEKILIRYERVPSNFLCPFEEHFLNIPSDNSRNAMPSSITVAEQMSLENLATLSRYMHHQRWVWVTQQGANSKLSFPSMARILTTLTKMRLQEGFHFAYNKSGVINLVLEMEMKGEEEQCVPCVVQYVLFPPHISRIITDNLSDDDNYEMETTEGDGECQLITECWIEPQHGVSMNCAQRCKFLDNLKYKEIAEAFFGVDLDVISVLLAFEHISLMCQNKSFMGPVASQSSQVGFNPTETSGRRSKRSTSRSHGRGSSSSRHEAQLERGPRVIPLSCHFDLIKLFARSQQVEMLFPTVVQEIVFSPDLNLQQVHSDICNELLFERFIALLREEHDREIELTPKDMATFPSSVYERERDPENEYPFPSFNPYEDENVPTLDGDPASAPVSVPAPVPGDRLVPSWKCFAKYLSTDCLVISILPSSFKDLKHLLTRNFTLDSQRIPPKAMTIIPKADSLPLSVGEEEEECEESSSSSVYCSLTLPLLMYKSTFSSLTDQLVFASSAQRGKDMFINRLIGSLNLNENSEGLLSLQNMKNEAVSQDPDPEDDSGVPSNGKAIVHFLKLIEVKFFSAFSDAIFHGLQFSQSVDRRDISVAVRAPQFRTHFSQSHDSGAGVGVAVGTGTPDSFGTEIIY